MGKSNLEFIRELHFLSQWFPQKFLDLIDDLIKDSEEAAKEVLETLKHYQTYNKLALYYPYGHERTLDIPDWSGKPWQLDFHNAGKDNQERMVMAANRVGKTEASSYEDSYHLTGLYPEWWEGRRFDKPILLWCGSPTNETSRDILQKKLIGGTTKESLGTGTIPKSLIYEKPKMRQAGVSDVIDTFKVRHISGGVSMGVMKTYEQGWRKWQGTEPDVVHMDEEPEDNEVQGRIYTEALTRLLTSHGALMVDFTPLLGVTNLVEHYQAGGKGIYMDTATWDDAPHLDKEARERILSSYPEHEREARTKGVPMMGEGRVFTTPEDDIKIDPFEIPGHFARIKGIDFGIDHPQAVVDIAWDRDLDIIYITRAWKKKDCDSEDHAQKITHDTPWIPVSWPHDGSNREKSSGKKLKDAYQKHGVKLLALSARYDNKKGGSQPVEPIVLEFNERCRSGGIKVFSTCTQFFDEYRNYHRKNGVLSKVRDDILKAAFYAVMMRRFAMTKFLTVIQKQPRAFSV